MLIAELSKFLSFYTSRELNNRQHCLTILNAFCTNRPFELKTQVCWNSETGFDSVDLCSDSEVSMRMNFGFCFADFFLVVKRWLQFLNSMKSYCQNY